MLPTLSPCLTIGHPVCLPIRCKAMAFIRLSPPLEVMYQGHDVPGNMH